MTVFTIVDNLVQHSLNIVYVKDTDNTVADPISRLDYDESINTCNINVHVRTLVLDKLCNCYVRKITNRKEYQGNNVYVPIGTHMFVS